MNNNIELRKAFEKEGYTMPVIPYIANMPETQKFIEAEKKAIEYIKKAAEEMKKLYAPRDLYQDFWKQSLPEVIAGILENFQNSISSIACISFLERNGYDVKNAIVEKYGAEENENDIKE